MANSLGAARNILSTRLKRLIACGILELRSTDGSDRYLEYDLTEKGRDLMAILVALEQWGNRWATPARRGAGARRTRHRRRNRADRNPNPRQPPVSPEDLDVMEKLAGR